MEAGNMAESDWQCDKSLLDCLDYLFTSGTASDVAFVVNGGKAQILAHKTILVSRSSVFCTMLDDPTISKWEITLLDTQQHIFSIFLRYLYTDHIELTVDIATSVLPLARQYCVNHLVRKCETFLKENFASQNAVMFLQNSSRLSRVNVQDDDMNDNEEEEEIEMDDDKKPGEFLSSDQKVDDDGKEKSCQTDIYIENLSDDEDDKHSEDNDEDGGTHVNVADVGGDKHLVDADEHSEDDKHLVDADEHSEDDKHLTVGEDDKHLFDDDLHHGSQVKNVPISKEKSRTPVITALLDKGSAMNLTVEPSTSKVLPEKLYEVKEFSTPTNSGVLDGEHSVFMSVHPGISKISATSGSIAKFTTLFRADDQHNFSLRGQADLEDPVFHIGGGRTLKKHSRKKLFACTICGKGYRREDNLSSHLRVHSGEKPFKCDDCDEAFSLRSSLVTHRKKHIGEKSHRCDTCGLEFDLTVELKKHQKKHRGDKPHICDFCGKGFRVTGNLRSHLRTHTGEKPHKCDICGKGFNETGNLRQHQMTHKNSGEKSYICDVCGKGFDQPSYLGKHLRIHSGIKQFKCEVCGKSFNKKFNLQTHNKTHTGEKPHKCNICGKGFGLAASLRRHLLMHTGEKPHMCFICGKSYQQKESLQQHHKKTHNT